MTIEERQALKKNIIDSIQSFDIWRQEEVERGGVRVHLQCTKRELDFLLDLIENKGEWEDGNNICPKCGENKFKGLDADIYADWQPNFCPNCGADMREPKPIGVFKCLNDSVTGEPIQDMREPKREKMRCNTCKNNDDELSGECYECIKNIRNHYEPRGGEE